MKRSRDALLSFTCYVYALLTFACYVCAAIRADTDRKAPVTWNVRKALDLDQLKKRTRIVVDLERNSSGSNSDSRLPDQVRHACVFIKGRRECLSATACAKLKLPAAHGGGFLADDTKDPLATLAKKTHVIPANAESLFFINCFSPLFVSLSLCLPKS